MQQNRATVQGVLGRHVYPTNPNSDQRTVGGSNPIASRRRPSRCNSAANALWLHAPWIRAEGTRPDPTKEKGAAPITDAAPFFLSSPIYWCTRRVAHWSARKTPCVHVPGELWRRPDTSGPESCYPRCDLYVVDRYPRFLTTTSHHLEADDVAPACPGFPIRVTHTSWDRTQEKTSSSNRARTVRWHRTSTCSTATTCATRMRTWPPSSPGRRTATYRPGVLAYTPLGGAPPRRTVVLAGGGTRAGLSRRLVQALGWRAPKAATRSARARGLRRWLRRVRNPQLER